MKIAINDANILIDCCDIGLLPALIQLEEPHFFKVIYPKKEVPKVAKVATIKPTSIPQNLDNRAVVIKQKQINVAQVLRYKV